MPEENKINSFSFSRRPASRVHMLLMRYYLIFTLLNNNITLFLCQSRICFICFICFNFYLFINLNYRVLLFACVCVCVCLCVCVCVQEPSCFWLCVSFLSFFESFYRVTGNGHHNTEFRFVDLEHAELCL